MKKILIFGGTVEGRLLAEKISSLNLQTDLCVATDYGEKLAGEHKNLNVIKGRLEKAEMENLLEKNAYSLVVDATHPFAKIVSQNIIKSFYGKIKIIRLERNLSHEDFNGCVYFDTAKDCAEVLKKTTGNILLTTGSKNLKDFCADENLRKRIFARVIPSKESLEECEKVNLEGKQIIAMQGPFSKEMNCAFIDSLKIKILVSKESGKIGGLDEKIEAAKNKKIKCFIIKNQEEKKLNLSLENYEKVFCVDEAVNKIFEELKISCTEKKFKNPQKVEIFLAGAGPGNPKFFTWELTQKLQEADFIFGSKRLLEKLEVKGSAQKIPFYLADDIISFFEKMNFTEKRICAVILYSGDSAFFSGAKKAKLALEKCGKFSVNLLPGISSFSYLASKLALSYENIKTVSLHGTEKSVWTKKILEGVKNQQNIFFLTSGLKSVKELCAFLQDDESLKKISANCKIKLGKNLSYADEKIFEIKVQEADFLNEEGLYSGFIIFDENWE